MCVVSGACCSATRWAGVVWRAGRGGGFWAGGRLAADCAAVLNRGAAARNSLRFAGGKAPFKQPRRI